MLSRGEINVALVEGNYSKEKYEHKKYSTEVENMHTIIGLLKKDCGISFMYKIAVEEELQQGILKTIELDDFKMKHDFDFIWEKGSIYSEKYTALCEELIINQEK